MVRCGGPPAHPQPEKAAMRTRSLHTPGAATLLVAALCLVYPVVLEAQTVTGTVRQGRSSRPVAGARVELLTDAGAATGAAVTSDSAGAFTLSAPSAGVYRVRAGRTGYRTAVSPAVQLPRGERITMTLSLVPDTVQLAPIVVTGAPTRVPGELGGFYERQRQNAFGTFITRQQIDRQRPFEVTDLLRTTPGLIVTPAPFAFGSTVRTTEGCAPAFYLDGVRFALMGETIDEIVNPNDVEAIEVYAHPAEVPAQFAGFDNACGAIVVWTRRGP
jgi:hypothetical protein